VCGSRGWWDRDAISDALADLVMKYGAAGLVIVHGDARGADRMAAQEAQKHGLLVEAHPADWGSLGKAAGVIRNRVMAAQGADMCVAFWDGLSAGTENMIREATFQQIPVRIVPKDGERP